MKKSLVALVVSLTFIGDVGFSQRSDYPDSTQPKKSYECYEEALGWKYDHCFIDGFKGHDNPYYFQEFRFYLKGRIEGIRDVKICSSDFNMTSQPGLSQLALYKKMNELYEAGVCSSITPKEK